jgi:SpoVK/Ycf46/Vps4 family AAA+-type ATPase
MRRKIWEIKIDAGICFCGAKGCGMIFLARLVS